MVLQVIKLEQQSVHLGSIHRAIIVPYHITKVSIPLHATILAVGIIGLTNARMGVQLWMDEWRIILAKSPLIQSSEKVESLYFTWWHQRILLLTE